MKEKLIEKIQEDLKNARLGSKEAIDPRLVGFYQGKESVYLELLDFIESIETGHPEKKTFKNTPVRIYCEDHQKSFSSIRSVSDKLGIPSSTISKRFKRSDKIVCQGFHLVKLPRNG